jgi:methyl-accepting chemotaxis protein
MSILVRGRKATHEDQVVDVRCGHAGSALTGDRVVTSAAVAAAVVLAGCWFVTLVRHRRLVDSAGRLVLALSAATAGDIGALTATTKIPDSACARKLWSATAGFGAALAPVLQAAQVAGWALAARSQEILDVSQDMAGNAEKAAEQAGAAAADSDAMADNIGSVAASVTELESMIREIARHATQATATAEAAAADAAGASNAVATLTRTCEQVDGVVRTIQSVAEQTHLLALNATIEAARAGQYGRGFSVVANEVKQLAANTSASTRSAYASVAQIRVGSAEAGQAMATIVDTCVRVRESQLSIAIAVEQQSMAAREIGQHANDVAGSVARVTDGIATIAVDTRAIAYAGGQAWAAATELAGCGQELETALAGLGLSPTPPAEPQEVESTVATTDAEGRTTIHNTDFGDGLFQLDYAGQWKHSRGNLDGDIPNSYTGFPGDTASLRFTGDTVDVYCVKGPNHGTVHISVDGKAPDECDQYAPLRSPGHLLWSDDRLGGGEHELTFAVTGRKNADSQYNWIVLERLEIGAPSRA